uniref:Uncharacterized protein n=1 Tax=Falco tinnunculus TaxID=100819 RepID=A0A8C4XJS5_FALTI
SAPGGRGPSWCLVAQGSVHSSTRAVPTGKTSATTQGSRAPTQTPMAALGSSGAPNPSMVQLLIHIQLSFHILNRSFNESLRDPTSKDACGGQHWEDQVDPKEVGSSPYTPSWGGLSGLFVPASPTALPSGAYMALVLFQALCR